MEQKIYKSRIVPKGDIEANWNKALGFIPLDKEIIIYTPDENHTESRIKIGDGKTVVQELPFFGGYIKTEIQEIISQTADMKLDKTGGTIGGDLSIQGNLNVTGTTVTKDTETVLVKDNVIVANSDGNELLEEAGFAVKTGTDAAYGIMYDPVGDGVKIGLGTFDENGKFEYAEGEDQFLATRDDTIADGVLVKWDDTEKKLVSAEGFYIKPVEYSKDSTIDTVSDGGVFGRVYIKDKNNNENSVVLSSYGTNYAIPIRNSNGNFYVRAPKDSFECVNKEYADSAYVKTIPSFDNNYSGAYVQSGSGATILNVLADTNRNAAGYISRLMTSGATTVEPQGVSVTGTPKGDWDCVPKKFVEDLIAANKADVDLTDYVKFTDIATGDTKAGVVKMASSFQNTKNTGGIFYGTVTGLPTIRRATNEFIDQRSPNNYIDSGARTANVVFPICPANLDYAGMSALAYCKAPELWTDDSTDENGDVVKGTKTKACETIGALKQINDVTTYREAYTKKPDGTQEMLKISDNVNGTFLVVRRGNGNIYVPTEVTDEKAAISKKQVDDLIAGLQAQIDALKG